MLPSSVGIWDIHVHIPIVEGTYPVVSIPCMEVFWVKIFAFARSEHDTSSRKLDCKPVGTVLSSWEIC